MYSENILIRFFTGTDSYTDGFVQPVKFYINSFLILKLLIKFAAFAQL